MPGRRASRATSWHVWHHPDLLVQDPSLQHQDPTNSTPRFRPPPPFQFCLLLGFPDTGIHARDLTPAAWLLNRCSHFCIACLDDEMNIFRERNGMLMLCLDPKNSPLEISLLAVPLIMVALASTLSKAQLVVCVVAAHCPQPACVLHRGLPLNRSGFEP